MLIRLLQLVVVRYADRVVVPSKYIAHIVEQWGVERARIAVIYNGVDIGDVGVREVIRGLLHFEGKLIVSVGRLVPWKGFDDLIKLVPKLRKKFPDLKLLIIGNGPDLERLERLAEENAVTEHVIFAGSVLHPVLMRYFRASDMFVLNSSYEGLSHLVLEAMAVGIPVITTKVGGNPEVIDDGVNGYLVRARDQKAIESRITSLFTDASLYKKLVDGGFRKVSQFTYARVAEENASLLKALCAS
jgi:glycosyltransferase involved in cell wall biosynthesis